MAEEKNENEIQIDLGRIFLYVWHKIWIVIISFVLGAVAGFTVAQVTKVNTYSVTATYIVYYDGGEAFGDALTYQTRIESVLGSCVTFVRQNRFAKVVTEELNSLYGYDVVEMDDIFKNVTYSYSTKEGNQITITSTSTRRLLAYYTLVVVTDNFSDYIRDNYGLAGDTSLIFSLANDLEVPDEPVSNNSTLIYTALGAVGATALCMFILGIIYITDQRVKGEEDLINKYDIAVLGSVPNFEDKDLTKGGQY